MLIRQASKIQSSEITPGNVYLSRRRFLAGLAVIGGGLVGSVRGASPLGAIVKSPLSTDEKPTPYADVTSYNNYYEFGTSKEQPARYAKTLKTSPWAVSVEGAVAKPRKYDLDSMMKMAPMEERIYRHRCVEGWSIVVPWIGFSLNTLIKQVEPTSKAKFVAFESLYDLKQMPMGRYAGIALPYVEGLRMDEAMHPLAMLCFGLYGELLPNQNGAPIRLVVPWKYGFKSIKSIVKIRFVDKMPPATWNLANPREYGFYSNVNPAVDNPRYSQATELRLGEFRRRKTLPFNGYADQVASLYAGMDLRKNY
jgi:methionine sulfoxide reductase catalytic subunit